MVLHLYKTILMKNIIALLFFFVSAFSFAQFTAGQTDDISIVDSPFDGFATFDLTINQNQTLNGEDPADIVFTYHNTLLDAVNDNFPVTNPTAYLNLSNPETIYIRMESASDPSTFQTTFFDITVEGSFNLGLPEDKTIYELPFDGIASFDLTENESLILNIVDPSTVNVSYYNSQIDADSQTNALPNPTAYNNTANPETIFVRVELVNDPNFFATTSFNLEVSDDVVNIPDADFLNAIISNNVDTNNNGNIQFSEAANALGLNLFNQNISDLTGIEAFTNIQFLNCNDNSIASLDLSSNTNLVSLDCDDNFIQNIDLSNNPLIESVKASINPLNQINLSNNPLLKQLWLINTDLTSIDLTNNTELEELQMSESGITTLDLSNSPNLTQLYIVNNPLLETVFIKNGADESSNMDSGSWLENWIQSNNPSLQYVCADDFQVADIQQWAGTDYVVNAFCSFQPGGDFNTITGTTQFDLNNDGCDPSDPSVPYIIIEAGPGPSTVTPAISSDENGVYNYYLGQATSITLQPFLENPSYFNISPDFPNINIPVIDNSTTTQDFCLTANGSINDAEVVIAPVFPSNPGFDATYKLVYKNKGNQVLSGNVTFQYDDSVLDFVSSTETPDAQATGNLTYNFTNLLPFESKAVEITLNVNSPMETPPVNNDDVLDFSASVIIDQTEETPSDNTFDYSEVVVGSFDPNDITCLQGDVVPGTEIGEFLHYMIRFENTGTAAAQKVVVTTDINPADYSISTLQVLDASHDMFVHNNNGVVEFVFEDIQLAAGGGHGNILLKIKTQPTLTLSDEVEAQADIYFDFNFPIITNVATTAFQTLSDPNFSPGIDISIYPNPTQTHVDINVNASINSMSVFDIQGREVLTSPLKGNVQSTRLDVSGLAKGLYILKVNTSKGSYVHKLIKE